MIHKNPFRRSRRFRPETAGGPVVCSRCIIDLFYPKAMVLSMHARRFYFKTSLLRSLAALLNSGFRLQCYFL